MTLIGKLSLDNKEILKKSISFLIFRGGGLLCGYFFIIFITNLYGARTWGLISLSFTIFLFIGVIGRLGLDINVVRYYSKKDKIMEEPNLFINLLLIAFLISAFLAFGLFIFREKIAIDLFKKPDLLRYFPWILPAIPMWSIILINGGLLRSQKKIVHNAFLDNPGRFAFSLMFFVLAALIYEGDAYSAIKAHFFAILTLFVLSIVLVLNVFKKAKPLIKKSTIPFIKKSLPILLSSSLLIVLGGMDVFVLGIFETDAEIGIYNVNYRIATLSAISLQAINSILAPKIAQSFREREYDNCNKMISYATRLNVIFTIFIISFIILFNEEVLSIFGEEFLEGKKVLFLLCLGQVISSLSGSVGVIFQMTFKDKIYNSILTIALLLNIILNFSLIPYYGIYGAAIATVVSLSFWNISGAIYLKNKIGIRSYFNVKKYESRI